MNHLNLQSEERQFLTQTIDNYRYEGGIFETLKWTIYRIKQAIKSIFFKSDWQLSIELLDRKFVTYESLKGIFNTFHRLKQYETHQESISRLSSLFKNFNEYNEAISKYQALALTPQNYEEKFRNYSFARIVYQAVGLTEDVSEKIRELDELFVKVSDAFKSHAETVAAHNRRLNQLININRDEILLSFNNEVTKKEKAEVERFIQRIPNFSKIVLSILIK